MRGTRIVFVLAGLLLLQFVAVIAFRAFFYRGLYIAPNEPYGIADLIEFVLGSMLMVLGAAALLAALVLAVRGPGHNRVAAALLALWVLVLGVLLSPLHTAAAKWSVLRKNVAYSRPVLPNPSLHLTGYGWLRQPPPAGELKR